MYAVIDLGSNTIRLSVYRVEDNAIKPVFKIKSVAGLANYVDESGDLSEKGIMKAVSVLTEFDQVLSKIDVGEVYAFATASLRNIRNTEHALSVIRSHTDTPLQVLSGEQEAVYGYIGATHHLQTANGVLVDIGGGSTELVFYRDDNILKALSIPVGCLNMYSRHVGELIPTKGELKSITDAVRSELDKIDRDVADYELICGVGGTIRAACKLNNEIFDMPQSNTVVDAARIKEIIKILRGGGKESLNHILRTVPERIHTVIPGLTILQTVAEKFKCKTIHVSEYGVREGFLFQKLISEGVINE